MKISKLLMPTLREKPNDAEVISHIFMARAGLVSKVAAGIYNYLPFGYRVIRKVEQIIREEMDKSGAQELLMPMAVPAELWQKSGRWDKYGKELLRFKDRKGGEFCLGPTHEEVITSIAGQYLSSYKQLPVNLYQIQGKFRDEIRPRFGLMRGREFIMKDAYSFHDSQESLDQEYDNMYRTYCRIFERCGLQYKVVDADSGNIGGSSSQEFMVLAPTGEDLLISCTKCEYAANVEAATAQMPVAKADGANVPPMAEFHTPEQRSIEEVSAFLSTTPQQAIKTLVYYYKQGEQESHLVVLIRGDREINEIKLRNYLGADVVLLAEDQAVIELLGVEPGFCGPVGKSGVRIVADLEIAAIENGVTGANKKDYHLINVVPGRDFTITEQADLRLVAKGDCCPKCGSELTEIRGIEVGHIFKLGTKYSAAMQAEYLDQDGKAQPFIMGCYGIGVGRAAAAAVEQNNDANGIVWPLALAPYQVTVIPVKIQDQEQMQGAEDIYQQLLAAGVEVLLDDRDERIGVKLKDQELIGIPMRIVVGKDFTTGKVEFRLRNEQDNKLLTVDEAISQVVGYCSQLC